MRLCVSGLQPHFWGVGGCTTLSPAPPLTEPPPPTPPRRLRCLARRLLLLIPTHQWGAPIMKNY